jgi:hypothetical protein
MPCFTTLPNEEQKKKKDMPLIEYGGLSETLNNRELIKLKFTRL